MVSFDKEWQRVLATNQEFSDAVMKYRELEQEFDEARGTVIRIPAAVVAMKGPQCEASTYTEYKQLGSVARITCKVSISACPGGTTGKFAVVARVRDKAGKVTLVRDAESSFLERDAAAGGPIDDLLGQSITYRVAVGPRAGQKVFSL
jgi:hypothetical protein